jgi:hypothetical protein
LNRLAGLINNHGAIFTKLKVPLQFLLQNGIEVAFALFRNGQIIADFSSKE